MPEYFYAKLLDGGGYDVCAGYDSEILATFSEDDSLDAFLLASKLNQWAEDNISTEEMERLEALR